MDEKKQAKNLGKNLLKNLGKTVEDFADKSKELTTKAQGKIVDVMDRDGNGKLDRDDFGLSDENIQAAKESAQKLVTDTGEKIKMGKEIVERVIAETKEERDRKILRPIFEDDLANFREKRTTGIIHIVGRDKKRDGNVVCGGAIGYREAIKGMEILNIYEEYASKLEVCFYPHVEQTFYYADPYQDNSYISIDSFFDYFKKERVNELEIVAQKLGAKKIQISYKEKEKVFVKKAARAQLKAQGVTKVDGKGELSRTDNEQTNIEIMADITFNGYHAPTKPQLVYFKNEGDIEKLVLMRMNQEGNQITSKTYRFKCDKLIGMNEQVAGQIDAVLAKYNVSGNTSMTSELQRESRTELEYHIEF